MLRNLKLHWRRLRDLRVLRLHGVQVRCGPDDVPRSVRSALFKESYEAYECELVKRILRPGDRVLEIGTGIGLVSLVATRLAGEGNVLSCEANPEMEAVIRANYALNGWTPNLRMQAVTADGGPLTFYRNDNILSSSAFDRQIDGHEITVPSVALAEVIAAHRPSVLVMDVEGSEVELLPAADLSGIRAVIVEMHPHIVGPEKIMALVAQMAAQGLQLAETRHKTFLLAR
jgi:FkbM family methyltransferase